MPGISDARPALALLALALVAPSGALAAAPTASCLTPVAADEPPCNPALAQSPWAMAHRGSYEQHSSPWPGPAPGQEIAYEHTQVDGVPLVLMFSAPYPDGGVVVWGAVVGSRQRLVKLDHATGQLLASWSAGDDQAGGSGGAAAASGVYSVLDRDNHVIVGRDRFLEVYGDRVPGQRSSPIDQLRRFALPERAFCRASDRLVGLNMLSDGMVAYATQQGVIGVLPREPGGWRTGTCESSRSTESAAPIRTCPTTSSSGSPTASRSTSAAGSTRSRARPCTSCVWDGSRLVRRWRTPYRTGGAAGGARVGEGSGSTPALMGVPGDRDRFVVITDGQKLMHLVLFWRDRVPRGWQPIAPGRDRRIACEVPVRFGDPQATDSVSEQSVLVRGHASVVVNNHLRLDEVFAQLPPQAQLYTNLAAQDPTEAPYGVERIDWDPRTRTCGSRWANRDVSIPNGVPTMSSATGLVYGIGQRQGVWGLEGLDFGTRRAAALAAHLARADRELVLRGGRRSAPTAASTAAPSLASRSSARRRCPVPRWWPAAWGCAYGCAIAAAQAGPPARGSLAVTGCRSGAPRSSWAGDGWRATAGRRSRAASPGAGWAGRAAVWCAPS